MNLMNLMRFKPPRCPDVFHSPVLTSNFPGSGNTNLAIPVSGLLLSCAPTSSWPTQRRSAVPGAYLKEHHGTTKSEQRHKTKDDGFMKLYVLVLFAILIYDPFRFMISLKYAVMFILLQVLLSCVVLLPKDKKNRHRRQREQAFRLRQGQRLLGG